MARWLLDVAAANAGAAVYGTVLVGVTGGSIVRRQVPMQRPSKRIIRGSVPADGGGSEA